MHKISGGHRKGTHSLLDVALVAVASLGAASWQAGTRASGRGGISFRPGFPGTPQPALGYDEAALV